MAWESKYCDNNYLYLKPTLQPTPSKLHSDLNASTDTSFMRSITDPESHYGSWYLLQASLRWALAKDDTQVS